MCKSIHLVTLGRNPQDAVASISNVSEQEAVEARAEVRPMSAQVEAVEAQWFGASMTPVLYHRH